MKKYFERNIIIDNGHMDVFQDPSVLFADGSGHVELAIEILPESTTWLDLLVPDVFDSRSQARKAGWGDIVPGFSEHKVGKAGSWICVWKPIPVVWNDDAEADYVSDFIEGREFEHTERFRPRQ